MADTKQATDKMCECVGGFVERGEGTGIWHNYCAVCGMKRAKSCSCDTGDACNICAGVMQPSQAKLKPPRHAFEVRITIGGNDWDYVLRTLDEIAVHIREHGLECGLASGGWDGSHSVDIETRDVTPDVYREELKKWRIARLEGGSG